MTMLVYSALLTLALVLSAPWWLLRMATTQRYREGLWERLGLVRVGLRGFVAQKKIVWVHAVSVGEVLAASRLVAELEAVLAGLMKDEGWRVVVSTTTRTGQALARERFGAARVFYMPLDFGFAVRRYLRVLRPAAVVLIESEIWPRLLHECARIEIPVVVVNARVSDRSFVRGMKVRAVWSWVLRKPTLWLAQSEEDARRLVAMGARAEAVRVGGNLKYDVRAPKESRVAALIREAAAGRPIVVAGSTVDRINDKSLDENEMLIGPWAGRLRDLGAMLVLAPRHPENFDLVYSVAMEYRAVRATAMLDGSTAFAEIVLLDTIGDLAAVYGVADVAFVGGSLIRRGGHNPLEPAQFGVPVVMGPSDENFRDIVAKMRAVDGIRIVQDKDELEATLIDLLANREAAKALGERGRQVFEEQQGATARAVEAILSLIQAAMIQGVKP